MKILKTACMAFALSSSLLAFEPGQLSLDSVSNFEENDASFTIRHRFLGQATGEDNFAGFDEGANTFLALRYAPLKDLIIEVHHCTLQGENNIRLGYAHKFTYLHTQLNLNYFQFKEGNLKEKRENGFANLVLQTPLIFEHLIITSNLGYDNYYKKTGLGLGLEITGKNFMPDILTFTQSMSLLGEYYSKYENLEGINKKFNAYAFGLKFKTFAHHFELLMTNATSNDPRNMFLGTNSNELHFGFNINRKF